MIGDFANTLQNAGVPKALGASPTLADDSIDLKAAKDIGAGTTFKVTFSTPVLPASGAGATQIQFQVVLCDNDAGANPIVVGLSPFMTFAAAFAGVHEVRCQQIYNSIGKQHLKVRAVSDNAGAFNEGSFFAKVSINTDSGDGGKPYPSGFLVQL